MNVATITAVIRKEVRFALRSKLLRTWPRIASDEEYVSGSAIWKQKHILLLYC